MALSGMIAFEGGGYWIRWLQDVEYEGMKGIGEGMHGTRKIKGKRI